MDQDAGSLHGSACPHRSRSGLPVDPLPRSSGLPHTRPMRSATRPRDRSPEITPVLLQRRRCAGHQHAIGALTANAGGRRKEPAQPRLQDVRCPAGSSDTRSGVFERRTPSCGSAAGKPFGTSRQGDQNNGHERGEVAPVHLRPLSCYLRTALTTCTGPIKPDGSRESQRDRTVAPCTCTSWRRPPADRR